MRARSRCLAGALACLPVAAFVAAAGRHTPEIHTLSVTSVQASPGPIDTSLLAVAHLQTPLDEPRLARGRWLASRSVHTAANDAGDGGSAEAPPPAPIELHVALDPSDLRELTLFSPVAFTVAGLPRREFTGVFSGVGEGVGVANAGGGVTGIINASNADGSLQPGMSAIVELASAPVSVSLRVPNAALAFSPPTGSTIAPIGASSSAHDVQTVWVYDGTRFTPIGVRTGLQDDQWTEILEGSLAAGTRVVTHARLRSHD